MTPLLNHWRKLWPTVAPAGFRVLERIVVALLIVLLGTLVDVGLLDAALHDALRGVLSD